MMQVLITGAGGFIGRHVVAALRLQGVEVIDVRDLSTHDLLSSDGRAEVMNNLRADTLVHLAWVTDHKTFWTSDLNQAWGRATIDLVSRFFAAGGRRVVAAGTCAEYSWRKGGIFSENMTLAPHTPYGAAKARTGERLLRLAEENDASVAWGRIFFPFGDGESISRLIPSMLRACLEKKSMKCGPPDTVRDIWDVRNLGAALGVLALSNLSGPINIASGDGVSFEEIGQLIQGITGTNGIIRFGERQLGQGEPPVIVADTTRLRHELGFKESVSLEVGLSDYCDSMRQ